MPKFGSTSKNRLSECDDRLQHLLNEAIKLYDFTVLEGHRGEERQNEMVEKGTSTLNWPDSKHNGYPSKAVDIAPWPVDWDNRERFYYLGGIIMGLASQFEYNIRWGGDWNQNGNFEDQSFDDLPHFEVLD